MINFELIIDETIINSLTNEEKKKLVKIFLRFIDFRREKCSNSTLFKAETTPRIMNLIKTKIHDEAREIELYHTLTAFFSPNNIASPEEGLSVEQEVVDLVNNSFPFNNDVCLITNKKYIPTKDKVGNTYKLNSQTIILSLKEFVDLVKTNPEFLAFLEQYK